MDDVIIDTAECEALSESLKKLASSRGPKMIDLIDIEKVRQEYAPFLQAVQEARETEEGP